MYEDEDAQVKDGYFNWDGKRLVRGETDRSQVPPGLYQVSVSVNGSPYQGSPKILLLGPDPLKSTVAADKGYLFIEDPDSAKVDVTLLDGEGQALTGWAVELSEEPTSGTWTPVTEASGVYSTNFDSGTAAVYVLKATARPSSASSAVFSIGQVSVTTLSTAGIQADMTLCNDAPPGMAMASFRAPTGMVLSAGLVCNLVFPSYVPIEKVNLLKFALTGLPDETVIERVDLSVSTVNQGQGSISGDKATFQQTLTKTINQSLTNFLATEHFWFKGTSPGSVRIDGTVTYKVPKGQSKTIAAVANTTIIDIEIVAPTGSADYDLTETRNTSTSGISFQARLRPADLSWEGNLNWILDLEYDTTESRGPWRSQKSFIAKNDQGVVQQYSSEGGKITARVQATYNGIPCEARIIFTVTGTQIPNATITQQLTALYNGTTPNLLTGIATVESGYRQFNNALEKYGVMGDWPLESSEDGGSHIGLMQMPTSMAYAWDWLANSQEAAGLFAANARQSENHESNVRAAHPTMPGMTGLEHENNALSLYRIGRYYYIPDVAFTAWIADPDNATGVDYAASVRLSLQ